MKHAEWHLTQSVDNGANTLTKQAEPGRKHVVTHISGSFSAAAIKTLLLRRGTAPTTMRTYYVHNLFHVDFMSPIAFEENEAVVLTLAASGTGGVLGVANMSGYTI